MPKPVVYREHTIERGDEAESIFGAPAWSILGPHLHATTFDSLARAKRMVDDAIKQAACPHDAGRHHGRTGGYEYCNTCHKLMGKVKHA